MRCGRHAAWSTATFMDGILTSFIVPFGPLLLLAYLDTSTIDYRYADANGKNTSDEEVAREHLMAVSWATAARLWSQVFAGLVAGRTFGKLVGPSLGSRLGAFALTACGLSLIAASQLWLGLAVYARDRILLARTVGGFLSGILCSGVLSLTGPCPPSSSCERCDTSLPGRRRNYAEIVSSGKAEFDTDGGGAGDATSAFQRADAWWHAGLTIGPLIGGLSYGSTLLGVRRPALTACVAACLSVAVFAAWGSPVIREAFLLRRKEIYGSIGVASGGGRGFPRRRKARFRHQADEDGGAETPLLRDVSVHESGVVASELPLGGRDVEAGDAQGPSADGPVSKRYLKVCRGDAVAAKKMWDETIRWRAETGAARSLATPQPTLEIIRECYPYFAHGRSRKGEVVVYELTGRMQFGRLAQAGVTPFDMQMHYAFFNDFVFGKLSPADDAQLMTVLDVGELRLSTLKNNTVVTKYLKATAEVMQRHYPERQSRILVVNAPWWFAGIWKTVSGVLASGTQAKLQIRGTNFLSTLLEHVDASQIPPEYGGSSPDHLGQSHEERALNKLAASLGPTSLPKGTMGTVASASHAPAATGGSSGDARDDAANGHGEEAEAEEADAWVTSSRHGDDATGGDYVREDGTGGSHGQGASALREGSSVSSTVGRARGVGSADGGGASAAGMGMSQRLASVVRRMRGRATQAYLGVENKFRYDTEHRMWIIDGDENDGASRGSGGRRVPRAGDKEDDNAADDSEKEGSEGNLVRAIQAAQQARGGVRGSSSSVFNGRYRGDVSRTWMVDGPLLEGAGGGSAAAIVLALYMAWTALEGGLEVLLPLWMLSPAGVGGGLDFSALDTAVVLSIATAALALPRYWTPTALLRITARSPVRTLRAATSVQVVATVFLSGLTTSAPTPLAGTHGATFTAVALAVATARASAVVARPALGNLLSVALGYAPPGGSVDDGNRGRRSGDRMLVATSIGVSQAIGILVTGVVFARAIKAGTDAGIVCFRLVAVGFVGLYLATLVVHATEGAGGGGGSRGGGWRGGWLATCDFVEEAFVATGARRVMEGVGGGSCSMAKES